MNAGILSVNNSPEELDSLIQSFEFENQQIVKFIEKENQLLEAVEKEMVQKKTEIERYQTSTTQLDEETKRAHKQFIQNRDNCESLRKTASVLLDHEVALMKKLNALIISGEQEKADRQNVLQHYTNIWDDYKAKYESFPLAKTYLQKQREVESSSAQLEQVSNKIQELKIAISSLQGPDVDVYDMKNFLVAVAKLKLETKKNCLKIAEKTEQVLKVEKALKVIKERKKRLLEEEEQLRVVEAKRQAELEARQKLESQTVKQFDPTASDNGERRGMTDGTESANNYIQTIIPEKSTLVHMYDGDKSSAAWITPLASEDQRRLLPTAQPFTSSLQSTRQPQVSGHDAPVTHVNQRGHVTHLAAFNYMPLQRGVTQVRQPPQQTSYFISAPPVPSLRQRSVNPSRAITPLNGTPQTPIINYNPSSLARTPLTPRTQQPMFKHPNLLEHSRGKLSPTPCPRNDVNVPGTQTVPEMQRIPSQRLESPAPGQASPTPQSTIIPVYVPQSPQIPVSHSSGVPQDMNPVVHQGYQNQFIPQEDRQFERSQSQVTSGPGSDIPPNTTSAYSDQPTPNQPKTPEHNDGEMPTSQPTTPSSHELLGVDTRLSPFDLEKHLERVRMLTKSPSTPQYSTRPMFTTELDTSDKQTSVTDNQPAHDDNPFMQTFFPDGRGDNSFQTNFSPGIGKPSEKPLFGMPDNLVCDRPSDTIFDFGGGSGGGAAPQSGSMFSLFGPGGAQPVTSAAASDGFSFNFGSSSVRSPPDPATSGFSLF